MSVSLSKTVLWLAALCLTGYLGWLLYVTKTGWAEKNASLTLEEQHAALDVEAPEEPARDDLVSYSDGTVQVKGAFITMDWSGKPPPPPPVDLPEDTGPTETPRIPVADLLKVFYIHQDGRYPHESYAMVEYTDPQLAAAARASLPRSNKAADKVRLIEGDHLPAPHDGISVLRVLFSGVVFDFDDEREPETVAKIQLPRDNIIYVVPPGELALMPGEGVLIPSNALATPFVPRNTTLVGENRFRVGTEDAARIAESYTEILTREVRHRRWRNPKTGQFEGVEITDVTPGGLAAAHGAKSGDVIKSINGKPVSSVSEAITFVKNNAETTTVWEVVVSNKGIDSTMIFETPPEQ